MTFTRLRPVMPAIYNPSRLSERPIPRAELTIDVQNGQMSQSSLTSSVCSDAAAAVNENDQVQEDLQTTYYDLENSYEMNNQEEIDAKPVVDVEDIAALGDLFNENENDGSEEVQQLAITEGNANTNDHFERLTDIPNSFGKTIACESTRISANVNLTSGGVQNDTDDANENLNDNAQADPNGGNDASNENANANEIDARKRQIDENVANVLLYGKKVVVNEEVEFIHIPGQDLQPIKDEPKYEVKSKDLLCGNKPFKQYVRTLF